MSDVQVKPLTNDEKHVGVIVSTDSDGNDTRVSAKRWDRRADGLASDWITISVYKGNSWWQEQELRVEDALRFALLIQHKAGASVPAPAVPDDERAANEMLLRNLGETQAENRRLQATIEAQAAELARLVSILKEHGIASS